MNDLSSNRRKLPFRHKCESKSNLIFITPLLKYRLTAKGITLKNLITLYFANYSPNCPELLR